MDGSDKAVRERAGHCCEYCQLPQKFSKLKLVIDHIIARQHVENDSPGNLALACGWCNRHKGPNIAGIDPETLALVRLFHPREDRWTDHFRWRDSMVVGI